MKFVQKIWKKISIKALSSGHTYERHSSKPTLAITSEWIGESNDVTGRPTAETIEEQLTTN